MSVPTSHFPEPSRTPFGHPLTEWDVRNFTHPNPADSLHDLHINNDGQVLAANGTVALRIDRGRWLASDFKPAPPSVLDRLAKLPWHKFPTEGKSHHWRDMDEAVPALFRYQYDPVFEKPITSPVWKFFPSIAVRIAEGPDVPLSVLQLISRLPRAEIYTEGLRHDSPVFFRFTGGAGVIAHRKTNQTHRFSIFKPRRDHEHRIIERQPSPKANFGKPAPPEPILENWPPAEPTD